MSHSGRLWAFIYDSQGLWGVTLLNIAARGGRTDGAGQTQGTVTLAVRWTEFGIGLHKHSDQRGRRGSREFQKTGSQPIGAQLHSLKFNDTTFELQSRPQGRAY